MRVLFTTVSLDIEKGGGTAERTRQLAKNVAATGVSCEVLAINGGTLVEDLLKNSIPVQCTGSFRLKFQIPHPHFLMIWRAVQRADFVHVLGYWNLLSYFTCLFAHMQGKPYYLCAAGEFAALDNMPISKRVFQFAFGRFMIAHAKALIAITDLERQQIMTRFSIDASHMHVIPNGVNEPLESKAPFQFDDFRSFVLFIGRLATIKGPDLLLEAFAEIAAKFPNTNLLIAGPDFGMKPSLEARISKLSLRDRVRFAGFLDEDAKSAAYRAALFLVVPSRNEAMSLVAIEAGAAGTPILLTDQCGFSPTIIEGGGRIVDATVEGLSEGLNKMLAVQSSLPEMGQRLRQSVLDHFAWSKIAQLFIEAIRTDTKTNARPT